MANLHSDKIFAEKELATLKKQYGELKAAYARLESDYHIADRDANKAYDTLEMLPEFLHQRDYLGPLQTQLKSANARASAAVRSRDKEMARRAVAIRASKGFKAASQSAQREVRDATERLEKAVARADAAVARVEQSGITVRRQSEQLAELRGSLNDTAARVAELEESCVWGEERVEELEAQVDTAEWELERLEGVESYLADKLAETAPKRGPPVGHRGG